MGAPATVLVVDDDASIRVAVTGLLCSAGYAVKTFASAKDLFLQTIPDSEHCLVLDVNLPDVDGFHIQETLSRQNTMTPIVFITGRGDIPTSVRAMKAGAVEFLTKPFLGEELMDAIGRGLEHSRALRKERADSRDVLAHYASLTPREKEVMLHVTNGLLNKEVAAELGTSEITVKVQRRKVMIKMSARTLPDLVRMADRLGLRERSTRR